MTITLTPELEQTLKELADKRGTTPETLALETLRANLMPRDSNASNGLEPRDEWEAGLLAIGTDCGVSLEPQALSSEGLYE